MVQLDDLGRRDRADLAALYWWRRDEAAAATVAPPARVTERVSVLAERAAPRNSALPGNSLRANVAFQRVREKRAAARERILLDAEMRAALPLQRREALVAGATGLVAIAASAAAAIYAAETHQPVALGFALAGMFAASFALYHTLRALRLMRSAALAKILP